jgi:hypothetical protein
MKVRATFFYIYFFISLVAAPVSFSFQADSTKTENSTTPNLRIAGVVVWQYVISNYLDAIGGSKLFGDVYDRTTIMSGSAMGQKIDIVVKQKAPNKFYQEINIGEVKQIMIFDGSYGKTMIEDEVIEIESKELERVKLDATMHFLLDPEAYDIKINYEGVEQVDSIDCHKLLIVLPSGIRWFQFYDTERGLKIKEQKEIQTQQGLTEQNTHYFDYREVDGLKFPFKIKQTMGIQEIELNVSSIILNSGIDDNVFRIPE